MRFSSLLQHPFVVALLETIREHRVKYLVILAFTLPAFVLVALVFKLSLILTAALGLSAGYGYILYRDFQEKTVINDNTKRGNYE